jgi:hypothetical protein
MAMDAQTLCARVRRDLADVEERIMGNPWLSQLVRAFARRRRS